MEGLLSVVWTVSLFVMVSYFLNFRLPFYWNSMGWQTHFKIGSATSLVVVLGALVLRQYNDWFAELEVQRLNLVLNGLIEADKAASPGLTKKKVAVGLGELNVHVIVSQTHCNAIHVAEI